MTLPNPEVPTTNEKLEDEAAVEQQGNLQQVIHVNEALLWNVRMLTNKSKHEVAGQMLAVYTNMITSDMLGALM